MNAGMHIGERVTFRWFLGVVLLFICLWSLYRCELWQVGSGMADLSSLSGFLSPELSRTFISQTFVGLADTVAIAVIGTVLAVLFGLPLGLLSSRAVMVAPRFAHGWRRTSIRVSGLSWVARGVAMLWRSVPEVVWAVILVRVIGLGPTAAVIAIGIAYAGMIAKVTAEQLESCDPNPAAALETVGAGRVARLLWCQIPQVMPGLSDYILYRCECAIRASAILGYVGGGGLGFQIEYSYGYGYYGEVTTQVVALIAFIACFELVVDFIRRKFT
jgi:phosphonate transport system permease protein